jgi:predicted nucleotidyltransferase
MTRDEVEARLRALLATERHGVAALYLFGSVARGTPRDDSDVDVGVLFETPPPPRLDSPALDLEALLERELGLPVQLVVLNSAPVDLRIRVLREGRLIVDASPSLRIRFEVATRNEYFDFEPILRAYRHPSSAADASSR